MTAKTKTIVLIEDDEVLCSSYTTLLNDEEDLRVVNAYHSCEDALKYISDDRPHVILLDFELQGINGIDAIPLIKEKVPRCHIIMLTVYESQDKVLDALANGASGYLTKNSPISKIIDSIREVMEGGGPMSTNVARMVIKSLQKNHHSPLSKRETQVLELVSQGKSRFQIAHELAIYAETVKTHISNIYLKLNVNSKADALKAARDGKLI
ncbi:MAG: response regulator transcription factor [Mucilaginibacter sp.]